MLGAGKAGMALRLAPAMPLAHGCCCQSCHLWGAAKGRGCAAGPHLGCVLEGRCLSQEPSPSNPVWMVNYSSKRQRPEVIILFLSDLEFRSCIINFNQDFCVNQVAVEEFSMQISLSGTEELITCFKLNSQVRVRLTSNPSPFTRVAAMVLSSGRDTAA